MNDPSDGNYLIYEEDQLDSLERDYIMSVQGDKLGPSESSSSNEQIQTEQSNESSSSEAEEEASLAAYSSKSKSKLNSYPNCVSCSKRKIK